MFRPAGSINGIARRVGVTTVSSGMGGFTGVITGHSGVVAVFAAACFGLAVNLWKIFDSIYKHRAAIVAATGGAKAKVIEAKGKRAEAKAEAKVKVINARSEARNSAKRTDAEVRASDKRTDVRAKIALMRQRKTLLPPRETNNDPDPGSGSRNVRPIRRPLGLPVWVVAGVLAGRETG
jgi:diacylglycerol kinase family enzyme